LGSAVSKICSWFAASLSQRRGRASRTLTEPSHG
jgi:hypothetical protein